MPERLFDVCDAVFAHDIEGEAAGAGHDAGVVADAAAILVEANVTDIMVPIFNSPVLANGGGPFPRREAVGGGEALSNFTALAPHAGGVRAEQGAASDADDSVDEGVPLGRGQSIDDGKDFDDAILLAGSSVVVRNCSICGYAVSAMVQTASNRLGWFSFGWTCRWLPMSRAISKFF